MALKNLNIINFRSYKSRAITLHPQLNLVIGPNGSGKTNLLEALYVLTQTKSYRARDEELIMHGQSGYSLTGTAGPIEYRVKYSTLPRKLKTIQTNSRSQRLEEYIGQLPSVLFEPNSVFIASGAPAIRRAYIDGVLCGIDERYLVDLVHYKRALKQRNVLLRARPRDIEAQIFAWDIKLVELSDHIFKQRQAFTRFLNDSATKLYAEIAGSSVVVETNYQSSSDQRDYASSFLQLLQKHLKRDLIFGNTGDGIHRDDLAISFNGKPVQSVASRGEVRTLTLAYKLLEMAYIEQQTKRHPIILLDDVFSELDTRRREFLLLKLNKCQSFITTTDLHGIKVASKNDHTVIKLGSKNA